jgi:hypothetical protein
MPISGTSSDYTGRTKDISIFQSADATIIGPQDIAPSFGKRARFCAGVQKLIQRYAIILLSNVNSQPNYPDFGTSFMATITAGISPVDKLAAIQIFSAASYDTVLTLRNYQATHPEIPPDEAISRAELNNISLYGSYAAFDVKIFTEAGTSVKFLVPLPK